MLGDFPLITTSQYKEAGENWLRAIVRGEDACIVFLPKTDREIRLGQLLNDRGLQKRILGEPSSFIFIRANFDAHDVEDVDDLSFQIQERLNSSSILPKPLTFPEWVDHLRKHKMRIILILPEAERYLTADDKMALAVLSEAVRKYSPLLRVLSVFETNITHPSIVPFLPKVADLYENIFYYPLYAHGATDSFIDLLCHQWHVSIAPVIRNEIIAACGGQFWLVKEAVREIATTHTWSSTKEGMQFRLRSFYNLLLPSEQTALYKLATRQKTFSSDERMSLTYLQTMRVIDEKRQFLIGALKDFLLGESSATDLKLNDERILFNNVPIEKVFSRKEYKVFKLLLEHVNGMVSRDEIAERIWPVNTQEYYSDWAIDQLIARLRQRCMTLSLPPRLIATVRGRGYLLKIS